MVTRTSAADSYLGFPVKGIPLPAKDWQKRTKENIDEEV